MLYSNTHLNQYHASPHMDKYNKSLDIYETRKVKKYENMCPKP